MSPARLAARRLRGTSFRPEQESTVNFNSVLIGSADAPRLAAYYTKLLGEPGFADGGYSGWQVGSGYLTVGPHSEVGPSNREPGRVIVNFESDDVPGDFAKFEAAGANRGHIIGAMSWK
jgi:hypothetical protein